MPYRHGALPRDAPLKICKRPPVLSHCGAMARAAARFYESADCRGRSADVTAAATAAATPALADADAPGAQRRRFHTAARTDCAAIITPRRHAGRHARKTRLLSTIAACHFTTRMRDLYDTCHDTTGGRNACPARRRCRHATQPRARLHAEPPAAAPPPRCRHASRSPIYATS